MASRRGCSSAAPSWIRLRIENASEPDDEFGGALTAGDFNGDGDLFASALSIGDFDGDDATDLAIGVPFEDVDVVVDAGAVAVIYGDYDDGLTKTDELWHQDVAGVPEVAETNDHFGAGLR